MPGRSVFCLLIVGLLLSGCAFGHRFNYHEVVPDLQAEGTGSIPVATHDQRPYVLQGTTPQFVGFTRSGMGIPYNVLTQSDRPLAEDITQVVCNALQKKRFRCLPVIVVATANPQAVKQQLQGTTQSVALLLTLHEWKTDTYVETALLYNVSLHVLDAQGTTVSEQRVEGRDVLGANFWDPYGVAYTAAPQTLKKKLEELLNHPAIVEALHAVNRS